MEKPKIFLNVATYLPGYKGGGPIQSVKNMVSALSDDFDFYIFTTNHDLGSKQKYNNIKSDEWNFCYGAYIFYSSDKKKNKNLWQILKDENFSLIYLNSFFNLDTIRIISIFRLLKKKTPILLMPRGELSKGALNIKKKKKISYIKLMKLFGSFNSFNYIATAEDEYNQIKKILKTDQVNLLSNIPSTEKHHNLDSKENKKLKVVFLSRITEKKNLDYALKTLKNCKSDIRLDIYGTIEDKNYWAYCKKLINKLPINISVTYKGALSNEKVINTIANYDLFYFPTHSENYGHVISEALQASVPILISDTTPWINLEEENYGWIYKLSDSQKFSNRLDKLASLPTEEYKALKKNIYNTFDTESKAKKIASEYKKILEEMIIDVK